MMYCARMLAYIAGTVNQELLLRNEYLAAENRILKAKIKTPLPLTDSERVILAEIAHCLGRKAFHKVANAVKPDTIMQVADALSCAADVVASRNIKDYAMYSVKAATPAATLSMLSEHKIVGVRIPVAHALSRAIPTADRSLTINSSHKSYSAPLMSIDVMLVHWLSVLP